MKAIKAQALKKTYRTRVKSEGLGASFRALVRPQYKEIQAVNNIDLKVEQGDIVAVIGPN